MAHRLSYTVLALAGVLVACSGENTNTGETDMTDGAKPVIEPWGYPLSALDRDTRPQDDLYQFANGGWLAATEIPDNRSSVGFGQVMLDRNEDRIKTIIADLRAKKVTAGSEEQKIRDLYAAYMNEAAINTVGMAPLQPALDQVGAISSHTGIAQAMMDGGMDARSIFGMFIGIDSKKPTSNTVYASHAGTALPDKSYYERDSERLATLRAAYIDYMEAVFTRLGNSDARTKAEAVFALEKAIASNHWSRADRRDADRTYNPMTIDQLAAYAPGFPEL